MSGIEESLRGLIVAELSVPEPEALLNACLAAGLPLQRQRRLDAFTLRVAVFERELPRLEALAIRHGAELRVVSRRGGSRARHLLRRRLPLLLLGLLTLALVLVSSLFVWEIRLVGAEDLSRGELLRELSDCGLSGGAFWPGLDADALRDRMLLREPRLAWMAVNIHGSVAEVKLLRREERPESPGDAPAQLVATRAGLVQRVSVLEGLPLIQPGQAVLPGETLVSGRLESLTAPPRLVRAQGEVWADTWYTLTAVCPPAAAKESAESGARSRFALKIGGTRINFYQNSGKAIDGCDKIVHEYPWGIPGLFLLPVTLVREELIRYRPAGLSYGSAEETGQRLLAALEERIEGEILSYTLTVGESGDLTVVTLRAQCRENIAKSVDITP